MLNVLGQYPLTMKNYKCQNIGLELLNLIPTHYYYMIVFYVISITLNVFQMSGLNSRPIWNNLGCNKDDFPSKLLTNRLRGIFKNKWKDNLTCNSEPDKTLRTTQFGPERYLYLVKDYNYDQKKYYHILNQHP